MTLNAHFKKVRLTDGALDVCMLWLSELTMRDGMNEGFFCQRQKCCQWTVISEHYEVSTNFRPGLLQRGRRTGVELLNLVIIHIMQHHLPDILRCVVVCNVYYYEASWRLSNYTKTNDLESI